MSMMDQTGMAPPQGQGDSYDSGLRDLLDLARQLAQQADSDQEQMQLEQVTSLIAKLLATHEKEHQDMLGGKASPGMLARALGGR
jgi:hypothetical protein